jgi:hypothetical protein
MKNHTNIQCLTLITCALVLLSFSNASAQPNYVDSLRIENERSVVSDQLTQLGDSIEQTIAMIDQTSRKSSPKNTEKFKALSEKLNQNKQQLDKLAKELSTTSQNAWNDSKVKRIHLTAHSIRVYYKEEKKKYDKLVKRKKRTQQNE